MIIRAGMNIYPLEIENELKKDNRVKQTHVYGFNNKVVLEIAGDFSDVSEVKSLCIDILPAYQIPSSIVLLDELPQNASGKTIKTGCENA